MTFLDQCRIKDDTGHDELTALVQTLATKVAEMDKELAEVYSRLEDAEGELAGLREEMGIAEAA